MDDKKAQILARLNKRNLDRSALLKSRPLTPAQVFESNFNKLSADLQQMFSNSTLKHDQSGDANIKLKINGELNDLRQMLAESASILSKYEKTRYQKLLKDLESKSNDVVIGDDDNRIDFKNVPAITRPADAAGAGGDFCDFTSCDLKGPDEKMDSKNVPEFIDQKCEMSDLADQSIFIDSSYDFKDLTISNLAGCTLKISAVLSTLYASNLKNCTIISQPICTSIFVRNSKNCTFCLAGQQFRIHQSEKCDFYILVTSRAIVEHCRDLRFAPYELEMEKSTYEKAGLDFRSNFWDKVNDFDWPSKNRPSPNWRVLPAGERLEFSL